MPQSHFFMKTGDKAPARVDITVTRTDLADTAHEAVPRVSRREARGIVDQIFEEISIALLKDETVKLHTFGSFVIRNKRERLGRNPRTGVSVEIEPRKVIAFKASPQMRELIHVGYDHLLLGTAPSVQSDPEPLPVRTAQKARVKTPTTEKV